MTGTGLKKFIMELSPLNRKKNRPNTQKGNQKKSKKTGKRQIFKDLLAKLSNRAGEVTSSSSTHENPQNAEQGRAKNLLNINSRVPVEPVALSSNNVGESSRGRQELFI